MSTRAKVACPKCAAVSCRESRWLSRSEKTANPGAQPHRCLGCGHRFIVAAPARPRVRAAALVLGAALTLTLAGFALFILLSADSAEPLLPTAPPQHGNGNGTASPDSADKLQLAAHAGDADAQFRLGRAALLDHSGGRESAEAAVHWLRKAAAQNHAEAMLQLGKLYRSGIGLTQNYALAAQWIRAAALTGDSEAMVELGGLYRSGIGVERDPIQAYVWFNRAAAARNLDGAAERDRIALKLSAEELSLAQHRSLEPSDTDAPAPTLPAQ